MYLILYENLPGNVPCGNIDVFLSVINGESLALTLSFILVWLFCLLYPWKSFFPKPKIYFYIFLNNRTEYKKFPSRIVNWVSYLKKDKGFFFFFYLTSLKYSYLPLIDFIMQQQFNSYTYILYTGHHLVWPN